MEFGCTGHMTDLSGSCESLQFCLADDGILELECVVELSVMWGRGDKAEGFTCDWLGCLTNFYTRLSEIDWEA